MTPASGLCIEVPKATFPLQAQERPPVRTEGETNKLSRKGRLKRVWNRIIAITAKAGHSFLHAPMHIAGKRLRAPTLSEEAKLLKYYESKIRDICKGFGFPNKVHAAAIIFLKRFYLTFSVLDYDPKDIVLTSIYLSGKVCSKPENLGQNPSYLRFTRAASNVMLAISWLDHQS
jgi:hypothetical protein